MNSNYQKPLFIVGNSEDFKCFESKAAYSGIIFPAVKPLLQNSAEALKIIAAEIVYHWSQWLSAFHIATIAVAQKANTLVCNYGTGLKALCNNTNGLLLMDKRLKKAL